MSRCPRGRLWSAPFLNCSPPVVCPRTWPLQSPVEFSVAITRDKQQQTTRCATHFPLSRRNFLSGLCRGACFRRLSTALRTRQRSGLVRSPPIRMGRPVLRNDCTEEEERTDHQATTAPARRRQKICCRDHHAREIRCANKRNPGQREWGETPPSE